MISPGGSIGRIRRKPSLEPPRWEPRVRVRRAKVRASQSSRAGRSCPRPNRGRRQPGSRAPARDPDPPAQALDLPLGDAREVEPDLRHRKVGPDVGAQEGTYALDFHSRIVTRSDVDWGAPLGARRLGEAGERPGRARGRRRPRGSRPHPHGGMAAVGPAGAFSPRSYARPSGPGPPGHAGTGAAQQGRAGGLAAARLPRVRFLGGKGMNRRCGSPGGGWHGREPKKVKRLWYVRPSGKSIACRGAPAGRGSRPASTSPHQTDRPRHPTPDCSIDAVCPPTKPRQAGTRAGARAGNGRPP